MPSRRSMLTGLGVIGLSAAGAGWWRIDRSPDAARAPWRMEGPTPADVRLDAFRHAILAPNPHNRQPWLIQLIGDDQALIACDRDRRLAETDPFDRQITIGFGTFLELARIAAAERGHRLEIAAFPEGETPQRLDQRPVARLRFVADARVKRDPLFAFILARHTNRQVYAESPPPKDDLALIALEGVSVASDRGLLDRVAPLTIGAMRTEMETRRTWMESVNLTRLGAREIDAAPDGISVGGPMIEALSAIGLATRESLGDATSTAFKSTLGDIPKVYGSLPAIVWITTTGNARANQLDAGARYVRAALRLWMHPMSQSLQEYPEVSQYFGKVAALLGVRTGERLQMLARLGRAAPVSPSPRWPLESHFI